MAGKNFWENEPIVTPAPAPVGGVRPIFTAPADPTKAAENARQDIQTGNSTTQANNSTQSVAISQANSDRESHSAQISNVTKLANDYDTLPDVVNYRKAIPAFMAGIKAAKRGDGTGDSSLLYAYSQVMDPGSAVRDGDISLAQSGASTVEATAANVRKQLGIEGGGNLPQDVRDRLVRDMNTKIVEMSRSYQGQRHRAFVRAKALGIDPSLVVAQNDFDPHRDEYNALMHPEQAKDPSQQSVYADTGNGVKFGMDGGDNAPFDRERYLQQTYGVTGADEAKISTFWSMNSGNPHLTPDAVKQWYQANGYGNATPDDAKLSEMIGMAGKMAPGSPWAGFDTSDARKAYEDRLRKMNSGELIGNDNPLATLGPAANQAMLGLGDEALGVQNAIGAGLQGNNPVDAYRLGRDAGRMQIEDIRNAQPNLTTAAEIVGGIAPALFTGGTSAAPITTARLAREGAIIGGVSGFGNGEGATDSIVGAGIGTAAGGALGYGMGKGNEALAARSASRAASEAAPVVDNAATSVSNAATPEQVLTAPEQAEIAALAKKATGWGLSARAARKTLATKFAANPEAAAAAKRLGIDVPADVLADSPQAQSLTGLSRSEVGSKAETAWKADSARVAQYADQAMTDLGGSPDLSQISDDVLARLTATADGLQNNASALRSEVDAAIQPSARVEASNLQETLAKTINDYGGLAEAKAAMTPAEKGLLAMLGEGETAVSPTYARLNRIRQDIGDALNKGQGPWSDVNRHQLGEYYKALSADQMAAVEQFGGKELADKQATANALFSKMYDQREQMQELFGKNLEKGLAPLLRRAVTTGAKGDATALNKALDRLPANARGGAMVSAIMAQSRTSASHGGFSFANYTKLYRGLRENGSVFAKIAKAIGPKGTSILNDLHLISGRMAEAENRVLKTGKANQALGASMRAEGVISNVMGAAASKGATGAGAVVGGAVGGPGGAAIGASLANTAEKAISGAGASRLDKVHTLLSSPEFRKAVEDIAGGVDPATASNPLMGSQAFHNLGRALGLLTPESRRAWLTRIIANDNSLIQDATGVRDAVVGAATGRGGRLAAQDGVPGAPPIQGPDDPNSRQKKGQAGQ